ncbi:MAG: Smr protein/MutS2 [Acidobacteria bacterium]|nr:Smr protein/MutS2 [Acidobacteriota bacterium]
MSDDDLFDDGDGDLPVEIPITDTLDLHPFRPNEIRDVAYEYLLAARKAGFRQVRLIHGRGIGVQRENVQSLLRKLDFVEAFHDADPSGGGWGSTVVLLAPNPLNSLPT